MKIEDSTDAPRGSSRRLRLLFTPASVPYRALLLGNLLGKMMDRVTAQEVRTAAQLSLAQWRVLNHIALFGESTAGEIVSAILSDRAEVSRAVVSLEKRGMVKRNANPSHRQASIITLTGQGQATYARIRDQRVRYFEEWLSDFDEEARVALDESLSKILRRIVDSAPEAFEY